MDKEKYDLAKHMLHELESPSKELTDWEEKFIESVTDQFDSKGWLSDRQLEILDKIYAVKTS